MSPKPVICLALLLALTASVAAQNPPQNPPATNPAPAAQAATPAVIGPAKVAFVAIQYAVASCDEGKKESASLQQYIDGMSAQLQAKQKEVDTLKNQLELTGNKLNEEARADLANEIDSKDTALQRFQQDTQKDIDYRRQKMQSAIVKKMAAIIEKVAKEKGVNMVLFPDVANTFGYVDASLFITDDVIKAYNAAYPVSTAPTMPPVKK